MLQFKSFPQKFSQMGKVPQRPVWLVLPHGQVCKILATQGGQGPG
jgi:hypothetical protein